MEISKDWEELLRAFQSHDVEFLIVGGHAVSAYGFARYTQDLDLFVRTSGENVQRILDALKDFFGSDVGFQKEHFSTPNKVVMIGTPPYRVDVLTTITGITFHEAYKNREIFPFAGLKVPFIGYQQLIANKQAAGRPKDLGDAGELGIRQDRRSE